MNKIPEGLSTLITMKILKALPIFIIFSLIGLYQNQLNAQGLGCDPDISGPNVACFAEIEIFPALDEEIIIVASDHVFSVNDNCTPNTEIEFFITLDTSATSPITDPTITLPMGTSGTFPIMVLAVDTAGNSNVCWGVVTIVQNTGACDPDDSPPVFQCGEFVHVAAIPGEDIVVDPDWIITGTPTDSCTSTANLEFLLSDDLDLVSPPANGELILPVGTNGEMQVVVWAVDEAGNFSSCQLTLSVTSTELITGNVFIDDNQDCIFDELTENGMGGFTIEYTTDQEVGTVETEPDGSYAILLWGPQNNVTDIAIELLLPNGVTSTCPTTSTVMINSGAPDQNFSINLSSDCELMVTDISTNRLRRCLPSDYTATFCNLSTFDISGVELVVNLTDEMVVNSTGMPFTDLGNNDLLFELGTVPSGTCGQIPINLTLDCSIPNGAIVCVESTISPYGCADSLLWTGSNLLVTGECDEQNNQVEFAITNVGTAPMPNPEDFTVVEDVVMYMNAPIQLDVNESQILTFPANGSTWRVEIPQEPGHPSLSDFVAKTIEGCGGYGTMGVTNLLPTPDEDPFFSMSCDEVRGSFDPNDKQATPIGVSDEHFIEANTSIEYKIRFQNTGTDTAFTVRIEDQISDKLDFASIQTGASSHPYRIEIGENGLLIFHFENILLPDSTVNEPASHGFVQFRINQLADNAVGTVIENTADIYFDLNEAIVTNTVMHTIGDNFVTTSTNKILVPNLEITAFPNPFSNQTTFSLKGIDVQDGIFELYNLTGRLVKSENFSGNEYQLLRNGIPSGTYLFRFIDEKGILANGKIVIQ